MEYTTHGSIAKISYFDREGNAAAIDGVYGKRSKYNAYGDIELETWLDADGRPTTCRDGYAKILYEYEYDQGDVIYDFVSNIQSRTEESEKHCEYYQDVFGRPAASENGSWGKSIVYYPVSFFHEETFIDWNGEPVDTSDGYAIYDYETDEKENIIWEGYFDKYHAATNCLKGYSSIERGFDEEGRVISERYLDRYDKLVNNPDGVAMWSGYYDDNGDLILQIFCDQDRNPVE